MKRSEGKNLQIQHADWLLAREGVKTCTSRYGDRRSEYIEGNIYSFVSNDSGESLPIKITRTEVKSLKDVTSAEAKAIGNYGWAEHVADFHGIYGTKLGRPVDETTELTLIFFEVQNRAD